MIRNLLFALSAAALLAAPLSAAPASAAPAPPPPAALPGVALAQGVSEITGVAVSPLLGVSAVGAWRYFQTAEAQRAGLPWFCQPWAWGTGLVLLGLCLLKDTLGPATPLLVKKPLDMAELFEDKASALVAGAAVVPSLAQQVAAHFPKSVPLPPGAIGLAEVPAAMPALFVPVAVLAFAVVWLTAHALHVLIALCPFRSVDSVLKLLKTGLLATLAGATAVHPYLGAALAVLIIMVAAWLAPAAFRMLVLGSVFGGDVLVGWLGWRRITPDRAHAFTSVRFGGLPKRAYGRLTRGAAGRAVFTYRPWLLLPKQEVELPAGTLAVENGLLFPSLLHRGEFGGAFNDIVILAPRYRRQETAVAAALGITELRDSVLVGGLKAIRGWLRSMLQCGRTGWAKIGG